MKLTNYIPFLNLKNRVDAIEAKTPTGTTNTGGIGDGLTIEDIDDRVNALVQTGANITKVYDDANNTLTLSAAGGGGTTNTTITGAANFVAASQFPNGLQDAINAAVKNTLLIDVDRTITTAITVPANTLLMFINGAKITKGAGGSISFGGIGYADHNEQVVYFDGFAEGDIVFTHPTNYKRKLAAQNFGAASLSESLRIADKAVLGKQAEIYAFPGTFTSRYDLTRFHTLRLSAGRFRNTFDGGNNVDPAIVVYDDAAIYGAGNSRTTVDESITRFSIEADRSNHTKIIAASSLINPTPQGKNHNIEVADICFRNSVYKNTNAAHSAVSLGNCTNGHIRRCKFYGIHGFGAYIGGASGLGHHSEDCTITDNIFQYSGQNSCGTVNSVNTLISKNIFSRFGSFALRRLDAKTAAGSRTVELANDAPFEFDGAISQGFTSDMRIDSPIGACFAVLTFADGTKTPPMSILIVNNSMSILTGANPSNGNSYITKTEQNVKIDVVTGSAYAIDLEPNGEYDLIDRCKIVDNIFDFTDPVSPNLFGVKLHAAGALAAVRDCEVSRNQLIAANNGIGEKDIRLAIGIEIINADSVKVADNVIRGVAQQAVNIENCYSATVKGNEISLAGAADAPAIVLRACAKSHVYHNILRETYSTGWTHRRDILEAELGLIVSVNGNSVTRTLATGNLPYTFHDFWIGQTVVINGNARTVTGITNAGVLVVGGASLGTLTNVLMNTKFSSNIFAGNDASTVTLAPGGASVDYGF